ncbi:uncharacterized protein LOC111703951 [Eurytemora carolleeae]|uniref:uncharacterized protein LOC111703951 n=1 Tax=Eurytemora carolleeae TaxID=1294199 RepID=UPI000C77E294|nr:uncharacterized protein LOC111703951 [Eurytemora carolleeae]|eukprot:XP_023331817.1 uncharacterized protein LOC111703951 [Eurytemora affinis]
MKLPRAVYQQFQALVTRGKFPASVETLTRADLPSCSTVRAQPGDCDLLVKVQYSTLNYKDAMVVTGKYPGLKPPMVGGIDLVGSVLETKSSNLKVGQNVVVNGWGIGTDHYGGYAGEARLRSEWAIPLPSVLTAESAAKIGTAGYTAMLCVQGLENQGLSPGDGPILVTGATGGVGSVSVLLLSQLGYEVIAVSGKAKAEGDYLKSIGASQVLERSEFEVDPKPLGKERFAGCVDSCGGKILANVLTLTKSGGAVSACGLAGGMPLNTTVAPFILRGVTLVGIESVFLKTEKRLAAYERFSPLLTSDKLALVSGEGQTVGLAALPELGMQMLKGGVRGRYIVDLSL